MKGNNFEELRREAITMACPHGCEENCVADDCMAWREKEVVTWDSESNQRKSYYLAWCDLAGKCEEEQDLIGKEAGNGE